MDAEGKVDVEVVADVGDDPVAVAVGDDVDNREVEVEERARALVLRLLLEVEVASDDGTAGAVLASGTLAAVVRGRSCEPSPTRRAAQPCGVLGGEGDRETRQAS